MSRKRHRKSSKSRPVWLAGATAVVVGGAGIAFAYGPQADAGTPTEQISFAASASTWTQPASTASPSKSTGSDEKRRAEKRRHKGHGHGPGHHRPRPGRPTARPTTPTPAPTTPTAAPTTPPTAAPTTPPTTAPTTPPTTAPTTPPTTAPTTPPTTAPTTPTANPTTTPPSSGGSQTQQYQAEVIRLVNVERSKAGCNALTANSALTRAAQDHAADMLAHNYFSHESQDGTSPFTRMTAAGYRWSGAAENIAAGQQTPASVMQSWMNSTGHRANILNCGLKDIGVGYAAGTGAAYGQYWVQDFGSPA